MKATKITVRRGEQADLPAVHALVHELARYERAEHEFTASVADYRRDFDAGYFETLVAESGEKIVGMALYYTSYSTWKGRMLYLEDFVVQEACRGQGIGRVLFDAFLEQARQKGCRLAKWQILDWNEPALNFYEKYRAVIEKEWWNGKIFFEAAP
ncbi:MAG: GNAT family N-acetyltransferase [Lewinellaceae bacterium]|nr:GNAT family N-acetyltransferase [Phaeodactylibacter sp.]MCB9350954.1 GNAT family N-acetyltransferase [Lewinellaceae bacterium]